MLRFVEHLKNLVHPKIDVPNTSREVFRCGSKRSKGFSAVRGIVKALDMHLSFGSEISVLQFRRCHASVAVQRPGKAECTGMDGTVPFHLPKTLALDRPTAIKVSSLFKDVQFKLIYCATKCVGDKMSFVPHHAKCAIRRSDPAAE